MDEILNAILIMREMKGYNEYNKLMSDLILRNFGNEFNYSDEVDLTNLKKFAKYHTPVIENFSDIKVSFSADVKFNDITNLELKGNGKIEFKKRKFLFSSKTSEQQFNFYLNTSSKNFNLEFINSNEKPSEEVKKIILTAIVYSILNWYRDLSLKQLKK